MNYALKKGDKVGLISCSDGLGPSGSSIVDDLVTVLGDMSLQTEVASTLFRRLGPFSGTPVERANQLHNMFKNDSVKAIFDISGGDSANQILNHLDTDTFSSNPKPFFGYSDLTVLLNALYSRMGLTTFHYQLRHLILDKSGNQKKGFIDTFLKGKTSLFQFDYRYLRGTSMKGCVIGGNIRCFLKLAGTPFFPSPLNKLIFLESNSGGMSRIASSLAQLEQMGIFQQCAGLILGTFTQLQSECTTRQTDEFFLKSTQKYPFPIVKTEQLGHGYDSRCIAIGCRISI
ncbi:carboxypeptidase [Chitinispirillum alkaliphilum]|nr:carboxypeptidase [Chitinispirillum alkaliphilum]